VISVSGIFDLIRGLESTVPCSIWILGFDTSPRFLPAALTPLILLALFITVISWNCGKIYFMLLYDNHLFLSGL